MAAFPVLRTGAVAQYPLNRGARFRTHAVRFMDGSQQKFRISGAGLRRWSVNLELLDQQELAALITFAEQQGNTPFAFTDPVTGDSVSKCILSGEQFEAGMQDEMNAQATVTIEEIV